MAGWFGEGGSWGSTIVQNEACLCLVCVEQQWHPVLRQLLWRACESNITSLLGKWTNITMREMWLRWVSSLRAADNRGRSCSRWERTFSGHMLAESRSSVQASVPFPAALLRNQAVPWSLQHPLSLSLGTPSSVLSLIQWQGLNSEYSLSVSLRTHYCLSAKWRWRHHFTVWLSMRQAQP